MKPTIASLIETVSNHMNLADPLVVKFLCSVFIANQLPLPSPVWVFLVGPSSGGKSQLLSSFDGLPQVHMMDDLTPNTLVSGAKTKGGAFKGVLFEFGYGDIIMMKDFTVILEKPADSRDAIVGQFRMVYDGNFVKRFGNDGGLNEDGVSDGTWVGKAGGMLGATEAVHSDRDKFAKMGERFLMYTLAQQDDREEATFQVLERRMQNVGMSNIFKEAFHTYLNSVLKEIPQEISDMAVVPSEVNRDLAKLANWTTLTSSAVERDAYSRDKTIKGVLSPQMPYRVAIQLHDLAAGLMILNRHDGQGDVLLPEDQAILYKTALDTIPKMRLQVIEKLTEYHSGTADNLAEKLLLPTDTVLRTLEDLATHGGVQYIKDPLNNRKIWNVNSKLRDLMTKFKGIQQRNEDLTQLDLPE